MIDMAEIGKKTGQTCDVAGIALPLHSESLERQESPQIDELRHFLESLQPGDAVLVHAPAGAFQATVRAIHQTAIALDVPIFGDPWRVQVFRATGGDPKQNLYIGPPDAPAWPAPWERFETTWEGA